MFDKFCDWYKKYILVCNAKYEEYLLSLNKKNVELETELKKIVEHRMTNTNLSVQSDLDSKIGIKNDEIANLKFKISKIKEIRKEMVEDLSLKTIGKIYNKILKHPKVSKLQIEGTKLHVITKKLSVNENNIGHYKFTYIPEKDVFYIRNLEYVVDGKYDHWHVNQGDPCLAYWKPVLQKYLDTYQIFFFIDTLIHYLLLSSSTHAYLTFEKWIEKFKKKEKIDEKQKKEELSSATRMTPTQHEYFTQYFYEATFQNVVPMNSADWSTEQTTYTQINNTWGSWVSTVSSSTA